MKKVFVLTFFLFFLLGGVALWYFGHYRSAQEIQKAEPVKIFKYTQPKTEDKEIVTPQHLDGADTGSTTTQEEIESNPKSTDAASVPLLQHKQSEISKENQPEQSEQEASEHDRLTKEAQNRRLELIKQEKEETAVALEESALLLNEAHTILANQLKSMSVEKQLTALKQMREGVLSSLHPLTQKPLHETPEQAKVAWQDLLDGLVKAGYTLPEGYK